MMMIIAACICLGSSAILHLFNAKNSYVASALSKLDYAGIAVLVYGTAVPMISYGFACEEVQCKCDMIIDYHFLGYRNACFLTLGLGCLTSIFVTLTPGLDNPKYNSFRASLFVFLGLSAAAPLIIMQYHEKYCLDLPFTLYAVGGAVYIVGAVVYVIGYPERFRTGHFDNCGASHQIFHFLVLAGCLIHYIENYRAYIKNQDMICPI